MVTPRYFAASTDSSSWLCMKYLDLTGLFEPVIWITWHLPGLNSISQVASGHLDKHHCSITDEIT